MGNRLIIPNSDFSKIGIKRNSIQKIIPNDSDWLYGVTSLDSGNTSLTLYTDSNSNLQTINSELPGFNKFNNAGFITALTGSLTWGLINTKTYIFTIPENVVAIGGLFQDVVTSNKNTTSAVGAMGVWADDNSILNVADGYYARINKNSGEWDATDDWDTIGKTIVNSHYEKSEIHKIWPVCIWTGIYDYPTIDPTLNNKNAIMVFNKVFMKAPGAKYFIKTIFSPYHVSSSANSSTATPILKAGFNDPHLYWIFE